MLYSSPAITAYTLVLTGLFGLVMGSFINCWAWRTTHGESVLHGRSHCTSCGHVLGARDLVPLVSWALSRGTCRYCGEHVPARYPLTEALCAAVFIGIVARFGLTLETVELLVFAGTLLFLSLTDLDERIIPNGCILVALGARVIYLGVSFALGNVSANDLLYYGASAIGLGAGLLIVVLIADKLFGRESMGGGDLKLYFVATLYFGWQQGLFLIFVSCVVGLIAAFLGHIADRKEEDAQEGTLKRVIPFGPSIAIACIVTLFAGGPFLAWYQSLLV